MLDWIRLFFCSGRILSFYWVFCLSDLVCIFNISYLFELFRLSYFSSFINSITLLIKLSSSSFSLYFRLLNYRLFLFIYSTIWLIIRLLLFLILIIWIITISSSLKLSFSWIVLVLKLFISSKKIAYLIP